MTHQIDLYSSSTCPHCRRVKEFFAEHSISYTNYDVSVKENADKSAEVSGQRGVPVIVIDHKTIVVGADIARLQELLLGSSVSPSALSADFDLVIIGAGSAGLSAALYAGRKEMNTAVISGTVGGIVIQSHHVENYPGIPDVTGDELMQKIFRHAESVGIRVIEDVVLSVSRRKDGTFQIDTMNGSSLTAKAVIAAAGRRPRLSGAKREDEFLGKGVAVCTACDAPLYKGKITAVVGGGNTALDMADELADIAKEVHLIVRSTIKADEILVQRVQAHPNVIIHLGWSADEIYGTKFAEGIIISRKGKGLSGLFKAETEKIPAEGIFLGAGLDPNTNMFASFAPLNEEKEIIVDENCCTSIPGFFAAGDSTSIKAKQIASSVGEGVKALLSAYAYLKR
ncbi:MAG TPA: FAD-dependent oxidoreductase [Methanocorpusculum sp.]|nr:FAD-dependent oxidoreductase [Methanocorpusculum sp.]